jgi:hypothetical protein
MWVSSLQENISNPLIIVVAGNKLDRGDACDVKTHKGTAREGSFAAHFLKVSPLVNRVINQLFDFVATVCGELVNQRRRLLRNRCNRSPFGSSRTRRTRTVTSFY